MGIEIEELGISGVFKIKPFFYEDERGYFIKDFDASIFSQSVIGNIVLKEEFYSKSTKGVVRGMHFQTKMPQSKIVSCICGRIYDVVVDLRRDSDSFGKYIGIELSEYNHSSLFVPQGCAHGFMALEDNTITYYKCDNDYLKDNDATIKWDDDDLKIKWPMDLIATSILSKRDASAMSFAHFCNVYGGL